MELFAKYTSLKLIMWKPHRACGTRWINHKLLALENMFDKYGLYMQHFRNILVDTRKKKQIKLRFKANVANSNKPKR